MRAKRLVQFWNWLPAFRFVAESEHLPTAANTLNLTTSALSRSVRLLEAELGLTLFHRVGRRLVLSEEGRVFLAAVRDAMRRIDDGLESVTDALAGRALLSARSTHHWIMLPAIERLVLRHPTLVPVLSSHPDVAVAAKLRDGSLDIALVDRPSAHADLQVHPLATVTYGVYCGRGHPLFGVDDATLDDILAHSFVAPPEGVNDNWSPEHERKVGARVSLFSTGLSLCELGVFLALLPDPMGAHLSQQDRLHRLSAGVASDLPLFAMTRRPLGHHRLTAALLEALREVAANATSQSA